MFSSLSTYFIAQHHRWILWSPVALALGVGLYFGSWQEPSIVFLGLLLFISVLLLILSWQNTFFRILFTGVFCIALGFVAASYRTQTVSTPIFKKETGISRITGTVENIEYQPNAVRVLLSQPEIERISPQDTPKRVRIRLAQRFGVPEIGSRIDILGVLMPPSPSVSPRSYDFQKHMYFQSIGATGYAISDFNVIEKTENVSSQAQRAAKLRGEIIARILAHDTRKSYEDEKAVLIALLTGDRNRISSDVMEDIRKSGIAHLLAISGLHIGLVAGFVFFLARAFFAAIPYTAVYWPVKKISALVAFAAILFYCWLVGAPVSAERAVIMTGIVLFAVLIDRVAISLRLAAFAGFSILLIAPEMLFAPGFQMSFAAVVGLIAFYESYRQRWAPYLYGRSFLYKSAGYLLATLITTVVASLATAPFALYHFQRVSMLPGLLANMVAVPLTALWVMPLALIALLSMPLKIEGLLIDTVLFGVSIILNTAHETANMRGSIMTSPAWPLSALVCIVMGGLWMAIWLEPMRWIGLIPLMIGIYLIPQMAKPNILIGQDGKLIALHQQGEIAFSTLRTERFARGIWQNELNIQSNQKWPEEGYVEKLGLRCDVQGCIQKYEDLIIAFPKTQMAAYLDCDIADLIVAPAYYHLPKHCSQKQHITRSDIKQKGSHAVYYIKDENGVGGFNIETARDIRGNRPWTTYNFSDEDLY